MSRANEHLTNDIDSAAGAHQGVAVAVPPPETDTRSKKPNAAQPHGQRGERGVRFQASAQNDQVSYVNAFQTYSFAEEVMLAWGMNVLRPRDGVAGQPTLTFQLHDRVIMSLHTAKRLAAALGQMIRVYEERCGELHLNVVDRMAGK